MPKVVGIGGVFFRAADPAALAEWYQTHHGITDVVLLGIIIYALLGKFADSLTRLIERRVLSWHPAYQVQKEKN